MARILASVRWVLRSLGRLATGIVVLITAAFLLIQLTPGDPVQRLLGTTATADDIERAREDLGLNDPLPERYLDYMSDALALDFGESFRTRRPVSTTLADRAGHTIGLAATSLVVALGVSIPLGLVLAAVTNHGRRGRLEAMFTAGSGVMAALPPYVLAIMFVALFAVTWQVFPIAGADGPRSLVLPALATGLPFAAVLARIVRVEALTVLQSDYVRTVRSKRLPARTLYLRHVLPNVVTATLSIGGVFFGYMLAGSVVVESVFSWPGVGTELARAISDRDYPVLQGAILFLGLLVLIVNAAVDAILVMLDPRLRAASARP